MPTVGILFHAAGAARLIALSHLRRFYVLLVLLVKFGVYMAAEAIASGLVR